MCYSSAHCLCPWALRIRTVPTSNISVQLKLGREHSSSLLTQAVDSYGFSSFVLPVVTSSAALYRSLTSPGETEIRDDSGINHLLRNNYILISVFISSEYICRSTCSTLPRILVISPSAYRRAHIYLPVIPDASHPPSVITTWSIRIYGDVRTDACETSPESGLQPSNNAWQISVGEDQELNHGYGLPDQTPLRVLAGDRQ